MGEQLYWEKRLQECQLGAEIAQQHLDKIQNTGQLVLFVTLSVVEDRKAA